MAERYTVGQLRPADSGVSFRTHKTNMKITFRR